MTTLTVNNRRVCHIVSATLAILGIIYCALVLSSGSESVKNSGYQFLMGVPNYYFFYLAILPFVSSGIVYMAVYNINIRFFGELSDKLPAERKAKLLRFRHKLLLIAIVASLLIAFDDAMEKGRTLPPYSLDFSMMPENSYSQVVEKYFSLKERAVKNRDSAEGPEQDESKQLQQQYFDFLTEKSFKGESITGFVSLSSWYRDSSFLYKLESMLSWLAALVISIFVVQLALFIIAKDHVSEASKNLILWLIILCSFWIPTKIFSTYYHALEYVQPPGIVWFAIILLVVGIVSALFIKVEKSDMTKYAGYIAGVVSAVITGLSVYKPQLLQEALSVAESLGWVYGGVILFIFGLIIYLITDHLIQSYENSQTDTSAASITNDQDVQHT